MEQVHRGFASYEHSALLQHIGAVGTPVCHAVCIAEPASVRSDLFVTCPSNLMCAVNMHQYASLLSWCCLCGQYFSLASLIYNFKNQFNVKVWFWFGCKRLGNTKDRKDNLMQDKIYCTYTAIYSQVELGDMMMNSIFIYLLVFMLHI